MKLNVRLLLITSVVVILLSGITASIYYSFSSTILRDAQSRDILNAANDFVFSFQEKVESLDTDFIKLIQSENAIERFNLDTTGIDFIFTIKNDSLINRRIFKKGTDLEISNNSNGLQKFFSDNPNIVLKYYRMNDTITFYYGFQISEELLDKVAAKAELNAALIIEESPLIISNSDANQGYNIIIENSIKALKYKNNFDIYSEETSAVDFTAALVVSPNTIESPSKIKFVVFKFYSEGGALRDLIRNIVIIIAIAGSVFAFIIIFVLTAKFRKQIGLLSDATEITSKGDYSHRVKIVSKDEIGELGQTFNKMLSEIELNRKSEEEYTQFISLINRNPSLKEISDSALDRILQSTGVHFGVLYLVENNDPKYISSAGIVSNSKEMMLEKSLYKSTIENKLPAEFKFHDNYPEMTSGIVSIKLKYILVYPLLYNKEVVALLELGSDADPDKNINEYLEKIDEQLAIGISNARTLKQLENLVESKSQFLANMSHELRTPLISILGLTELMLKESSAAPKTIERNNIILRNGKKLLNLINNILEFSKLDTDKVEVRKDSFLLDEFLEEIIESTRLMVQEKNLKFKHEKDLNRNVLLNTDKAKLEQILLNLIYNSIKFTEKGEVKLKTNILDDKRIEFTVSDTGIGIPVDQLESVFSEFTQVDNGLGRKYGGAGLGLAISKKYIEMLESKFVIKSNMNYGTAISFVLNDSILDIIETTLFGTIDKPIRNYIGKTAIFSNNNELKNILSDYLDGYNFLVQNYITAKEFEEDKDGITCNAIVVDPLTLEIDPWELISELTNITNNREIIVASVDSKKKTGWGKSLKNLSDSEIEILEKDFNQRVKTAGMHPLDILKIIRDEIGIVGYNAENHDILPDDELPFTTMNNDDTIVNKNELIMVVDDNNDTLYTIGEILKDLGYETIFASNGVECLAILNTKIPDIILLDIMMPQMDGFQTIKRIKGEAKYSSIPVIALTAYAMLDNKGIIERNGFNDLITKPVNTIELETKIKKYLSKKKESKK
ncbi:MAG: response regulator [Melioribacteraceae bacterium]